MVTGHSLGGHLSTAFLRLFPNTPAEVVTVNGMGTQENPLVNAFFDALAERSNTSFETSRIANVFGSAGPNLAAGELLYTQQGIAPRSTLKVLGLVRYSGMAATNDR